MLLYCISDCIVNQYKIVSYSGCICILVAYTLCLLLGYFSYIASMSEIIDEHIPFIVLCIYTLVIFESLVSICLVCKQKNSRPILNDYITI